MKFHGLSVLWEEEPSIARMMKFMPNHLSMQKLCVSLQNFCVPQFLPLKQSDDLMGKQPLPH